MSSPSVALAVLFAGIAGIYTEFCAPGRVVPGAIGSVVVILSTAYLSTFSIDWRGAALIAAAFGFFLLEARYVTRGMLTALGAAAMAVGSVLLIATPGRRIHFATALAITIPFAAISSALFSLAVRARRNKVVTGMGQSLS